MPGSHNFFLTWYLMMLWDSASKKAITRCEPSTLDQNCGPTKQILCFFLTCWGCDVALLATENELLQRSHSSLHYFWNSSVHIKISKWVFKNYVWIHFKKNAQSRDWHTTYNAAIPYGWWLVSRFLYFQSSSLLTMWKSSEKMAQEPGPSPWFIHRLRGTSWFLPLA